MDVLYDPTLVSIYIYFLSFFFSVVPCGMWDLSSLTRD